MRISDWSSDVCSSDLLGQALACRRCLWRKPGRPLRPTLDAGRPGAPRPHVDVHEVGPRVVAERLEPGADRRLVEGARIVVRHRHVERLADQMPGPWLAPLRPVVRRADRKSGVEGKSVSVRVALGWRRELPTKKTKPV